MKRPPDPWLPMLGVLIFVVVCGFGLYAAGCQHQ
jgi:hypothetical protein